MNEENGEIGLKEVEKVSRSSAHTIYSIQINGDVEINTTAYHQFYLDGEGWVSAINLKVADRLLTGDGIALVTGIKKTRHEEKVPVFNFSIKDWVSYFVTKFQVYVHNGKQPCQEKENKTIPWSSGEVSDAAKRLENGATSVNVSNRSQAEELFLGMYQGKGYKNVTGMDAMDTKNLLGSKANTYHWDDIIGSDGFLKGHNINNIDATVPHLQIHPKIGNTIRIFFESN